MPSSFLLMTNTQDTQLYEIEIDFLDSGFYLSRIVEGPISDPGTVPHSLVEFADMLRNTSTPEVYPHCTVEIGLFTPCLLDPVDVISGASTISIYSAELERGQK